ncbi:L,D-transpeptidase family protein [Hydrogenimonas sp.]
MVKVYHARGHTARVAWFEKKEGDWVQVSDEWAATVGRNGLGKTKEGDGKTPVGVYPLDDVFGYERLATKMPFFRSDENLLCIDDARSRYYNRIVDRRRVIEDFKSFETMRRKDRLYAMVVTVGYNPDNVPGKGSCIFLHIKNHDLPTAGCVGLPEEAMAKLVGWLDPKKRPVVVIERWVPAARFALRN